MTLVIRLDHTTYCYRWHLTGNQSYQRNIRFCRNRPLFFPTGSSSESKFTIGRENLKDFNEVWSHVPYFTILCFLFPVRMTWHEGKRPRCKYRQCLLSCMKNMVDLHHILLSASCKHHMLLLLYPSQPVWLSSRVVVPCFIILYQNSVRITGLLYHFLKSEIVRRRKIKSNQQIYCSWK